MSSGMVWRDRATAILSVALSRVCVWGGVCVKGLVWVVGMRPAACVCGWVCETHRVGVEGGRERSGAGEVGVMVGLGR